MSDMKKVEVALWLHTEVFPLLREIFAEESMQTAFKEATEEKELGEVLACATAAGLDLACEKAGVPLPFIDPPLSKMSDDGRSKYLDKLMVIVNSMTPEDIDGSVCILVGKDQSVYFAGSFMPQQAIDLLATTIEMIRANENVRVSKGIVEKVSDFDARKN